MSDAQANYQTITVRRAGAVEWLTLNRPDSLNGLTQTLVDELLDYLTAKLDDHATRIIVLRGAGRAFCVGADIKAKLSGNDSIEFPDGAERLFRLVPLMRKIPQPIIALLHGATCGGGMALALGADFRIAGRSLKMNDAFATIGMSGCEMGLSYFLPRLVGLSVARELIYTGRFVDGERALRLGLVSELVDDDALEAAATPLIDDLLAVAPTGLRLSKRTLDACLAVDDLETVIAIETQAQRACQDVGDFDEAMRAFVEKRKPVFHGA